jgi:hypothetical protein
MREITNLIYFLYFYLYLPFILVQLNQSFRSLKDSLKRMLGHCSIRLLSSKIFIKRSKILYFFFSYIHFLVLIYILIVQGMFDGIDMAFAFQLLSFVLFDRFSKLFFAVARLKIGSGYDIQPQGHEMKSWALKFCVLAVSAILAFFVCVGCACLVDVEGHEIVVIVYLVLLQN